MAFLCVHVQDHPELFESPLASVKQRGDGNVEPNPLFSCTVVDPARDDGVWSVSSRLLIMFLFSPLGDFFLKKSRVPLGTKGGPWGARTEVIGEKMATDGLTQSTLWTLSGARLICHCSARQDCHAGAIIYSHRIRFPGAFDRNARFLHHAHVTSSQLLGTVTART